MLSEPFRIGRGVCQGDPISPLLYVTTFELFLRSLNKNLRCIPSQGLSFKTAAYADDLTIGTASLTDWSTVNSQIRKFEALSNTKIIKANSILVPLTANARRTETEDTKSFKVLNENDPIKVLGYQLDSKGYPYRNAWPNTINKLKKMIKNMKECNLSFRGKILVAKTMFISKIWHTAYLTPPNSKQTTEINNMITQWIKGKSKIFPSENYWAKVERIRIKTSLSDTRNSSIKLVLNVTSNKTKAWPEKWKLYLKVWRRAEGSRIFSRKINKTEFCAR
ncbi:17918_t:CDS:2 [Dentiscutata erythropus]|uniref:17918_t:CDS:1 n=1 Tax=Dentiscutata erythropus TaxID=1348616 RepID=A0A9N9NEV0_9GLOM|nr:17918_t:CDS:2 [Dentiscutata erythropus]